VKTQGVNPIKTREREKEKKGEIKERWREMESVSKTAVLENLEKSRQGRRTENPVDDLGSALTCVSCLKLKGSDTVKVSSSSGVLLSPKAPVMRSNTLRLLGPCPGAPPTDGLRAVAILQNQNDYISTAASAQRLRSNLVLAQAGCDQILSNFANSHSSSLDPNQNTIWQTKMTHLFKRCQLRLGYG